MSGEGPRGELPTIGAETDPRERELLTKLAELIADAVEKLPREELRARWDRIQAGECPDIPICQVQPDGWRIVEWGGRLLLRFHIDALRG